MSEKHESLEVIIQDFTDKLNQDDFQELHNSLGPCECRRCFERKLCQDIRLSVYQEIIEGLRDKTKQP